MISKRRTPSRALYTSTQRSATAQESEISKLLLTNAPAYNAKIV